MPSRSRFLMEETVCKQETRYHEKYDVNQFVGMSDCRIDGSRNLMPGYTEHYQHQQTPQQRRN